MRRRTILVGPDTPIVNLGGRPPRVVLVLLVLEIGLFLLYAFADGPAWVSYHLAASFQQTIARLRLYQLASALPIHLASRGVLLDAVVLWIFGSALERFWGGRRFLLFFVATGAAGLLAGVLLGALRPTVALAGSAGSTTAMLVAVGLLYRSHLSFLYGLLPLKAGILALLLAGFILVGDAVSGIWLGLAVQAGGGVAGLLFLLGPRRRKGGPRSTGPKGGPALRVLDGGKKGKDRLWN